MGILFHLSVYRWIQPTRPVPGQNTDGLTLINPTFIKYSLLFKSNTTRAHFPHLFKTIFG